MLPPLPSPPRFFAAASIFDADFAAFALLSFFFRHAAASQRQRRRRKEEAGGGVQRER